MATSDTYSLAGAAPRADVGARRRHSITHVTDEERARQLRQARRHSVLVRVLRLILPVAALASLGLYFLRDRIEIQIADGKFSGEIPTLSGDNLKMENPRYEGFTAEGGKFVVKAKTGYQDFRNPTSIRLIDIDSHLTQPNEQWAHLVSNEGVYDTKGELLKLSGDIKVTSSNGMTAYLKTADVQTKTQIVTTKDPVLVEMSNGTTVESDRMVLNAKTKEINFEGQVRTLLVRPPSAGKDGTGKDETAKDETVKEDTAKGEASRDSAGKSDVGKTDAGMPARAQSAAETSSGDAAIADATAPQPPRTLRGTQP